MKTRRSKKSNRKRYIVISTVAVVLVVAAYLASAAIFNFWPLASTPSVANSPNANPNAKTATPSPKNNNAPTKTSTQTSVDPGKTSSEVPVSTAMTATITTLSETDHQIHFAASVTNSTAAGTCVVTFSNPNDRPVVKQFDATLNGTAATCGPVSISDDEFSYLGTWQVSFRYYVGTDQATTQGTLDIQ